MKYFSSNNNNNKYKYIIYVVYFTCVMSHCNMYLMYEAYGDIYIL